MTRETLAVFALCFAAGPLLFALLLRFGQSMALFLALAAGAVAAVGLALLLQRGGAFAASLSLLWLGWILALALVSVSLRRRLPRSAAVRRWTLIAGLLATPLPWFGLALARALAV